MNRDLQATRFQQTTIFWCWQKYLNNFFVSLFEMENIAFFRLVNFIPCWIFALDTLYHTFGRVHEVRWDVTPVKFHSLNGLKVILQGLSILHQKKMLPTSKHSIFKIFIAFSPLFIIIRVFRSVSQNITCQWLDFIIRLQIEFTLTVITPSLPTFFMASAIKSPMALSPLAEIVATCSI